MLTLLTNADVFAPEPLGFCNLLIGGGRILGISPAGKTPTEMPAGAELEVIDLKEKRLIPGLVDIHAHITGGGGEDGASTKVPAPMFSTYMEAGVTSVVGLLGTDDVTRSTAELLAGVRSLREQGMSAWCWTGGYHLPATTLTGSVRGDIVHLDAVIGAGEVAISDHRSSQPTLDEILRTASDCHVGGLIARKAGVLHLHLGEGERGLELIHQALDQSELPPRVFQPTHVNRKKALFDEAMLLAERGCHIDLTAFPIEDGEDAYCASEGLCRYLDAGLPPELISISSDGGGCLPHFDEHGRMISFDVGTSAALLQTIAALVSGGTLLEDALPAFTSNPADHLRLEGKGRIKLGGDADLVVLDEACAIDSVMVGGVFTE
ncbi:MAG: beta-aspartyl-peptidase [Planctomycetota bacterium]|nr:beta-aspartyl-peptidase [Planctomycetota bacterium]MDA1113074.1 beta-aspartyl-peptidase [Planctomycetota bacterium]